MLFVPIQYDTLPFPFIHYIILDPDATLPLHITWSIPLPLPLRRAHCRVVYVTPQFTHYRYVGLHYVCVTILLFYHTPDLPLHFTLWYMHDLRCIPHYHTATTPTYPYTLWSTTLRIGWCLMPFTMPSRYRLRYVLRYHVTLPLPLPAVTPTALRCYSCWCLCSLLHVATFGDLLLFVAFVYFTRLIDSLIRVARSPCSLHARYVPPPRFAAIPAATCVVPRWFCSFRYAIFALRCPTITFTLRCFAVTLRTVTRSRSLPFCATLLSLPVTVGGVRFTHLRLRYRCSHVAVTLLFVGARYYVLRLRCAVTTFTTWFVVTFAFHVILFCVGCCLFPCIVLLLRLRWCSVCWVRFILPFTLLSLFHTTRCWCHLLLPITTRYVTLLPVTRCCDLHALPRWFATVVTLLQWCGIAYACRAFRAFFVTLLPRFVVRCWFCRCSERYVRYARHVTPLIAAYLYHFAVPLRVRCYVTRYVAVHRITLRYRCWFHVTRADYLVRYPLRCCCCLRWVMPVTVILLWVRYAHVTVTVAGWWCHSLFYVTCHSAVIHVVPRCCSVLPPVRFDLPFDFPLRTRCCYTLFYRYIPFTVVIVLLFYCVYSVIVIPEASRRAGG